MNVKSDQTSRRDKIIVFLLAFVPRVILIFAFAGLLRTPMDEMSTIATGAYFGGKDWTALTNFAGFYYGGGFTILFAPFFRLIGNIEVVYYIMLSACALMQSISAPISYHIMQRYFNVKNRKYLLIGSVACSFMVVTRAMEVFNEHIIIGCIWIIALLICRLVANHTDKRQRVIDTVLMMLIFSYMLTTHTRTNVIWIALPIVVLCFYFVYKRWLVAVIPAIITGAVGYFAAGQFNDMVKRVIWNWQEGDYLINASLDINISLSDLKDPTHWQGIFSVIFGQVNTIFIFTGGLAIFILIALIYLYSDVLKARFKERKPLPELSSDPEQASRPFILAVSVLFLLCVGAMIAAQSVTWLEKMVDVLRTRTYETNAYGYKAVTYIRYLGPFVGPLFMSGIAYIFHKKEEMRKYLLPSCFVLGVTHLVWLAFILPHITRSQRTVEVFTTFSWYNILNPSRPMGVRIYLVGSLVLLMVFLVSLIAYYKKNVFIPLILVTALLVYEYVVGAIIWDGSYTKSFAGRVDAGVAAVQLAEESGYSLPEEIYVYSKQKHVQKDAYTYQMKLDQYRFLMGRPEAEVEEAVVFSNARHDDEMLSMGYSVGKLDDNEFVYVNTDEYKEIFEAQGVTFSE